MCDASKILLRTTVGVACRPRHARTPMAKKKKRGRAARDEQRQRWQDALASVLSVLEWKDVQPEELRGALIQFPEIVAMLEAAAQPLAEEASSRLLSGLERCLASSSPRLRVAAWEALHEGSLANADFCAAAVAHGLHRRALADLGATDASRPVSLVSASRQLRFLLTLVENAPEVAEGLTGAEVAVLCDWGSQGAEAAAVAALQLILALTDGALDQPASDHVRAAAAALLSDASNGEGSAGEGGAAAAPSATPLPSERLVLAAAVLVSLPPTEGGPAGGSGAVAADDALGASIALPTTAPPSTAPPSTAPPTTADSRHAR